MTNQKCENCIHFDMCAELIARYHKAKKEQVVFFMCEDETEKLNCPHFKDKSLVVELPCKVGDEVWCCQLGINEVCRAKIIKIELNYYTPSNPYRITIEFYSELIGKHEALFVETDFKEWCYKSKEQAEEKLKEIEGK